MKRSFLSRLSALSLKLPSFKIAERGQKDTKSYRVFFEDRDNHGAVVSSWHDLPLRPAAVAGDDPRVFTYVNEIPSGTRAKMELLKEEAHNPIAQDVFPKREGQPLRYFSYGDMPFNYGFLPRTWENPDLVDASTKCVGDGDPIDVVQLSPRAVATGLYMPVRVLGVLALIDQGETDWKIIAEIVEPGKEREGYGIMDRVPQEVRDTITSWFRNYKTTEGKPQNDFAFGGAFRGADEALAVIAECAESYNGLIKTDGSKYGYWLR